MSDVKVFKLTTGEEIVGTVVRKIPETDEYVLDDTVAIVVQPTQDGRLSPAFYPWMAMIEGSKVISGENVICLGSPDSNLLNAYQSMFSKIITPKKGIIV